MEDPTRAVIEQWAREADWEPTEGIESPVDLDRFARLAFEAGRAAGIEEAAKVCEVSNENEHWDQFTLDDRAAAIRSLAPAVPT